jgi:hypothetical protein
VTPSCPSARGCRGSSTTMCGAATSCSRASAQRASRSRHARGAARGGRDTGAAARCLCRRGRAGRARGVRGTARRHAGAAEGGVAGGRGAARPAWRDGARGRGGPRERHHRTRARACSPRYAYRRLLRSARACHIAPAATGRVHRRLPAIPLYRPLRDRRAHRAAAARDAGRATPAGDGAREEADDHQPRERPHR